MRSLRSLINGFTPKWLQDLELRARLKPGARIFILASNMGAGAKELGLLCSAFPGTFAGSIIRSEVLGLKQITSVAGGTLCHYATMLAPDSM